VRQAIEPYRANSCNIGFILAAGFSQGNNYVDEGNTVADAVLGIIADEYGDIFEEGASNSFANVGPPGQVTLQIFANIGCPLGQDAPAGTPVP
jgi:hypothetical protein